MEIDDAADAKAAAHPSEGRTPQHLASATALSILQERVHRRYGAFGERAPEEGGERRVASAIDWRTPATLIGVVSAGSLFLSLVSRPAFDGPGAWASSLRLDAVFAVAWAPLLFWAMAKKRLGDALQIYLVLSLFIEAFSEVMFEQMGEGGYWDSVLWPASVAWFGTIKELTGIPGASLPLFFFVTSLLLYRTLARKGAARGGRPPRFARDALLLFLGTVLALSAIGLSRGGQVDWAFRQTIHLVQLPLVGLLFLYALRVPEDLPAVGAAIVVTAFVRSLLVAWVYFGVCVPQGITELPGKPEWCTTHSDSVLFVSALVVLLARALEPTRPARRRGRALLRSAAVAVVILLGIVLNNRRLAFVSLALALIVMYLALEPSRRKRRVTVALATAVPLLVGYVLVGSETTSTSPLWKPARSIASVLEQTDTSALSRDVENENLIYTLAKSGVAARGFGHEYEYSPNNPPVDLSDVFQNYRLIAHNGVLWLWSIAGVIGFSLLWLVYPLAGTLALRGYRAARSSLERTAGLSAAGCTAVCVVQIWGDQGLSSYMTLVTFALCFAVASRLAVRET